MSAAAQSGGGRIDVDFTGEEDGAADLHPLMLRAAELTWDLLGDDMSAEVSVAILGDADIARLNAQFRDKNKVTDVLSFPAEDADFPGQAAFLGDIALALPFVRQEAALENKSLENHVSHLFVHGLLHLLGYDHESAEDAQEMEALESDILARLGIDDPYAGRELDRQEP